MQFFFDGQRGDQFLFFGPKGGPEFFEGQRGGTKFFSCRQRGGPESFYVCKGGGQKKLAIGHHKQSAHLTVKYGSSLRACYINSDIS